MVAPRFCASAHSVLHQPHASGPPLDPVRSRDDSSPGTGTAERSHRDTSMRIASSVVEEIGSVDTDPCSIIDHLGRPSRAPSRLPRFRRRRLHHRWLVPRHPLRSITVTLGYNASITNVMDACPICTSHAADGSVCATIAIGTMIVAGCPATIVDASRTPISSCPPADAITIVADACPVGVTAPANDRCAAQRATLFFDAIARGVLNLLALQEAQT